MATTRYYLNNAAAPYTPATTKGAWDQVNSTALKLGTTKSGANTSGGQSESNANNAWDVLVRRFVSDGLSGSGTINIDDAVLALYESSLLADMYPHLHIWVTAGDSDTVRGTILTDHIAADELGNDSINQPGIGFSSLGGSAVSYQDGDRIVVEVGVQARNAVTTTRTATVAYGGTGSDAVAGSAANASATWIDFVIESGGPTEGTEDASLLTARREGTAVRLSWVTDPDLSTFSSHKVYKAGALVATVSPSDTGCVNHCLITGDTVGDTYVVQAHNGTSLVGRILEATTKAAPTLTITDPTSTSVPCSWGSVSGASEYRLYKRALDNTRTGNQITGTDLGDRFFARDARWLLVTTTTGTSYTDTDPLDGRSFYMVEVDFGDGTSSRSADVQVDTVLTKYVMPHERGQQMRWLGNVSPDGVIGGLEFTLNPREGNQPWMEDVAGVAWMFRNLPLSMSRYGQQTRDYLYDRLNTVPIVQKEQLGRPAGDETSWPPGTAPSQASWNDGVGTYEGNSVAWVYDFTASPATLKVRPFEFHDTQWISDLRFGYKIGSTYYTLGAFTTRKWSLDKDGNITITLAKTENGATVNFSIVVKKGRAYISAHGTGCDAVFVTDYNRTGSSDVAHYDGTTYYLRAYKAFGVDGDGLSTDIGTLTRFQREQSWTVTADSTQMRAEFSTPSTSTLLLKVQGGTGPYPVATYGSYYTDAFCDDDGYCLGSPLIPGRVFAGGAVWLEANPDDTAFKTRYDAALSAAFATRNDLRENVAFNKAVLALAYAIMANNFTGYDTNRDTLITETNGISVGSGYGALFNSIAKQERGDTFTFSGLDLGTSTNPTLELGMMLVAITDKHSTNFHGTLSELLRRASFYTNGQAVFNDIDNSVAVGTTGEASAHAIHALGDMRESSGGVCPVRIGRTRGTNDIDFTDGAISSYSWDADTNVYAIGVDKDVWLYTGRRGKPTSITRSSGSVTLTETETDPNTGTMTADTWFFDESVNLLKVGVTSAQTLAVTFEDSDLVLTAGTPTADGIPLSWVNTYPTDGFIGWDVKEGTTLIQRITNEATTTYTVPVADGNSHTYTVTLVTAYDETVSNSVTAVAVESLTGTFAAERTVVESVSGSFAIERTILENLTGSAPAERVVVENLGGTLPTVRDVVEALTGTFPAERIVTLAETITGGFGTERTVTENLTGDMPVARVVVETLGGSAPATREVVEAIAGVFATERTVEGAHVPTKPYTLTITAGDQRLTLSIDDAPTTITLEVDP